MTGIGQSFSSTYRGPDAPRPSGGLAKWADRLESFANALRARFDKASESSKPWFVVAVPVAATAVALYFLRSTLGFACQPLPVALVRLEVTYSAPRFAALLAAEHGCRLNVLASFIPDSAFAVCYAIALCSTYLWVERWRRFGPGDQNADTRVEAGWRHFFVILPLIAGLLDAIFENIPLLIAGNAIDMAPRLAYSQLIPPLVVIGSLASTAKWTALLLFAGALVAELFAGPRGQVISRLRFSMLAVALGAVPLLLLAQGQDILERLAEGEYPATRIGFSLLAIAFAATSVWYCGRKLIQFQFTSGTPQPPLDDKTPEAEQRKVALDRADAWYKYFGERVPRILGVTVFVLSGAAFASAGLALTRYVIMATLALLTSIVVQPRSKHGLWLTIQNPKWRSVAIFLLLVFFAALIVWPHWWRSEPPTLYDESEHALSALRVAAAICLVATWLFYAFVFNRRAFAAARKKAYALGPVDSITPEMRARWKNEPSLRRLMYITGACAGLSVLSLVLFTVAPVWAGRGLGPLLVLSLAVGNAVFWGSLTVWVYRRWRVPLLEFMLALAVIFSLWNDNHPVRRVPQTTAALAQREQLTQHFDEWYRVNKDPIILVAAAGGGLRAAYWTAMSLAALQDSNPAFASHVFAISGVSGGSVGGAVFAALVHDARADSLEDTCWRQTGVSRDSGHTYSRCVRRFMRQDFLSPVLGKIVAPDFVQRFLPFPIAAFDRSQALEDSWESSYRQVTGKAAFGDGILELGRDTISRLRVPSLFLNAAHVESGRRYVASPFRFDGVLSDAADQLSVLNADVPLKTAVHNSARFTYVSPAGHLDRRDGVELGHVVDGGYFENSGLATLQEILAMVHTRAAASGTAAPRIAVLYLCNDPVACKAGRSVTSLDSVTATNSDLANEVLAPAKAVLAARDARGSLAKAEIEAALPNGFFELDVCDRLRPPTPSGTPSAVQADTSRLVRSRDRVVSPPLGWLLSRLAREWMDSSFTTGKVPERATQCRQENAAAVSRLLSLLKPAAGS